MTPATGEKEAYLSEFERFEKKRSAHSPSWIRSLRQEAMSRFAGIGFPTTRNEDWKYTTVGPIGQVPYRVVFEPMRDGLSPAAVEHLAVGPEKGARLVFLNGHYAEELSSAGNLPAGVRVESLARAMVTDPDLIRPHLAQHARYDENGFTALSTAFLHDGALVVLPRERIVEEPIELLFLSTAPEGAIVSHPRNLFLAGAGSRATIIETYAGGPDQVYLTNAVTEAILGEGAEIDHYKILREGGKASHVGTTQVEQGCESVFSSFSIALTARFARNNLHVLLGAERASCTLNGLYLLGGEQFVDNHTAIDHAKPQGTSRELYKGILDGRSRAVFNGKVMVRRDAQKTDAQQTNRNLLLSVGAEVDSKPQLEIFADDVKCSHGAAIGQLSGDEMFYLESRGIGPEAARRLLTYGFATDVVRRIGVEAVRAKLDRLVMAKLGQIPGTENL